MWVWLDATRAALTSDLSRGTSLGRRRGGRKRALGTRVPMLIPQAERPLVARFCCRSVHRWPPNCVSLVVVDDGTRECLAFIADASISGAPGRPASSIGFSASAASQRRSHAAKLEFSSKDHREAGPSATC